MHHHVRGARVANDVCERFLENPEKRRREIRRQNRLMQIGPHIALDARARLEFIRLPFQRRNQAQMIQNAGP